MWWFRKLRRVAQICSIWFYGSYQTSDMYKKILEDYKSPWKAFRGILHKIWVRVGHGTSPIWLKFCMWTCFGVLTMKCMFQSSGKFYFGSFDHGLFRSALKGSQYGGSKDFLSYFCPAQHNLLPKTINTTLKGYLSTDILCQILL